MKTYGFTLLLADDPRDLDEWSGAVLAAGGDDSTCAIIAGQHQVSFDREAASLEAAIRSASETIRVAGLRVLSCQIEPEDMEGWLTA